MIWWILVALFGLTAMGGYSVAAYFAVVALFGTAQWAQLAGSLGVALYLHGVTRAACGIAQWREQIQKKAKAEAAVQQMEDQLTALFRGLGSDTRADTAN